MIASRRGGQTGVAVALAVMSASGLAFTIIFTGFQTERRREGAPTVREVQTAYDQAAANAGSSHEADLKVVRLDCSRSEGMRYSCRVDFVKTASDPTRVFLDTALIERRTPKRWTLLRGLCRNLS